MQWIQDFSGPSGSRAPLAAAHMPRWENSLASYTRLFPKKQENVYFLSVTTTSGVEFMVSIASFKSSSVNYGYIYSKIYNKAGHSLGCGTVFFFLVSSQV